MKARSLTTNVVLAAVAFWLAAPVAQDAAAQVVAATQPVTFDVYLPLQNSAELDQLLEQLHTPSSPNFRQWLTPSQFLSQFGPSPESIAAVSAALTARGFTVISTNAHGVRVSGTAATVQTAFGATLVSTSSGGGAARLVAQTPLQLPAELSSVKARIVTFTTVPPHRTHSQSIGPVPDNRYSNIGPYWFDDLKQAYDFPSYQVLNGGGRTIAIVDSSDFLDSDLQLYFGHENLRPPHVERVDVCAPLNYPPYGTYCGSANPLSPPINSGWAEVSLDLQQAGGMAPNAHIKLFIIPDLYDSSIMAGYQQIVDDNAADIVSSSFGGPEAGYFASYNCGVDYTYVLQQYEDIYRQGNAQGITFIASSGDSGGLAIPSVNYFESVCPNPPPNSQPYVWVPGVDEPAASPHVTAVGGTNLVTTTPPNPQTTPPTLTSKYVGENAWGDPEVPYDPYGLGILVSGGYWGSGGGTSQYYAKPSYQYFVNTGASMRTVPDISLEMGGCPLGLAQLPCPLDGRPRSYVITAIGGEFYGLIGTSVSAPGIAGVLALEEEQLGGIRLGNVNYQIYAQASQLWGYAGGAFHTNIDGFNGYDHATGFGAYNQVLGVGTPDVRRFIFAPFAPPAGTPQTPSNP
jgi:subtilase family serine protease